MRCWSGTAIYPALFKDLKDKYAALPTIKSRVGCCPLAM
jgi:hypothetical protein